MTIKYLVNYSKNKYNVDIDHINYENIILSSSMDGDDDFNKTIEELIKKTTFELIDCIKYVEIKINGSIAKEHNGEWYWNNNTNYKIYNKKIILS